MIEPVAKINIGASAKTVKSFLSNFGPNDICQLIFGKDHFSIRRNTTDAKQYTEFDFSEIGLTKKYYCGVQPFAIRLNICQLYQPLRSKKLLIEIKTKDSFVDRICVNGTDVACSRVRLLKLPGIDTKIDNRVEQSNIRERKNPIDNKIRRSCIEKIMNLQNISENMASAYYNTIENKLENTNPAFRKKENNSLKIKEIEAILNDKKKLDQIQSRKMFYANGDIYDGALSCDSNYRLYRHGKGVMEYKNGDIYRGHFESDKMINGILKFADGTTFKIDSSGNTTITYTDNCTYCGYFINNTSNKSTNCDI